MRGPSRPGVPPSRPKAFAVRLTLLTPLTVLALTGPASAAPGLPDATFGTSGTSAATGWADAPAIGRQVVRAGDGRLLVAGRSGRGDLVLERLRVDGSPDTTFGSRGRVTLDLGSVTDDLAGVVVDARGRTLVGGGTDDTMVLTRLLPDGRTDPTYGDGGEVRLRQARRPFPAGDPPGAFALVRAQALAVDADGGAMLAARLQDQGQNFRDPAYVLLRVDADGHRDPSFGVDGVAHPRLADYHLINADGVDDIVFDADGTALLTGRVNEGEFRFVRRIRRDGVVDPDYKPEVPFNGDEFPTRPNRRRAVPGPSAALETLPDGRYLVARRGLQIVGTRYVPRAMLLRYLPSGDRDASFGDRGVVVDPEIVPTTAKLGPDGDVYVLTIAGALRRFTPDGTMDTGFTSDARGELLVRDPDGLTVVAADTGEPGTVRRTSVGWDGRVQSGATASRTLRGGAPASTALAAAQQSDGRIVQLAAVGGRDGGLTRLTLLGTVDRTFGTDGVVAPPAGSPSYAPPHYETSPVTGEPLLVRRLESSSLAVDDRDRILVAAAATPDGTSTTGPTVVRRLLPGGSLDPSWGVDGTVRLTGASGDAPQVSPAPGGGVTVLARDGARGVFIRLTASGIVDTTWGDAGRVTFQPPQPNGRADAGALYDRTLGTLADGRVVAAGRFDAGWFATQLLPDGRPDTNYGTDGWTDSSHGQVDEPDSPNGTATDSTWPSRDARSAVVAPDGRLVVGDLETLGNPIFGPRVPVVRIVAADGRTVDRRFAPDAMPGPDPDYFWGSGPPRVAVQSDGRILLASSAPPLPGPVGGPELTTARFEPDGSFDRSFGDGGVSVVPLADGRVSEGWPTAVTALRDGRSLVLGDARGDAAAIALSGGGTAAARRPVLRTQDVRVFLGSDTVATVPMMLSAPSSTPVVVHVRTEGGQDRADPIDRTVTIPAGAIRADVPVRMRGTNGNDPAVLVRLSTDDVRVRRHGGDRDGAIARIYATGTPAAPRPSDQIPPRVTSEPGDPSRVRCSDGYWTGTAPLTFSRVWLRSGAVVPGESAETIAVTPADRIGGLSCRVTASNEVGSADATSQDWVAPTDAAPVTDGPGSPPRIVAPPALAFPPNLWSASPNLAPTPGATAPVVPRPARTRVSRLKLTATTATLRTDRPGRLSIRIDAVGSTVRAVRRVKIAATQWRGLTVRRAGTARLRLAKRLPAGRYRVRVYPGTTRRGTPLATLVVRVPARR